MTHARTAILTIGHSNRSLETFLQMLQAHSVARLVDVRTVPRSRHNPQFNRETLPASLATARIEYLHMAGLGGLRHPKKNSINTAWRTPGFRGYADYMQTAEFDQNLLRLMELGREERIAVMCAESVPWRCHRSLIADALTVHGVHVEHILSESRTQPHKLTPFARVEGTRVSYPGVTDGIV